MAQPTPPDDEFSDDDLDAVEPEFSDDDLEALTPDASKPAPPAFYLRDSTGILRPVSADVAQQARGMGLQVITESEARAMKDAPRPDAPAGPRPPAKDPGLWRTLGREFLQGFTKQGADEAAGAIAAAGSDLGPGARLRMPDGSTRPAEQSGDVYRAVRDMEREVVRGARENRGPTAFVANMAGDLASDAALSALGVPVSSTPYQVASGALSGLMGNDAELSTDDVKGGDVASAAGSTLVGGALGYVLPKVGAAVGRALPGAMASLRAGLESSALDKARKVLTSGSGQLARRKPVSDAAAREALDSGAIPIWGTTEGAFNRLKETAEVRGQTYADILTDLEAAGVQGPQVEVLARRFAREGADRRANSGANKGVAAVFENEAENIRAVAPRERVPEGPPPAPKRQPPPEAATPDAVTVADDLKTATARPRMVEQMRPNLPLAQAERIKRALQADARFDKIQATGLDEAKQEVSSMYREAIERAIQEAGEAAPPGSEVASLAERFIPTKRQLAATLEARDAAERGAGAASARVGGAAGVNTFDIANARQASNASGLGSLALAMAQRVWKERGPSTMANVYDVGAEAAGNFGKWAGRFPEAQRETAGRVLAGPAGRQYGGGSDVSTLPESEEARAQRALAEYLRRNGGGQ